MALVVTAVDVMPVHQFVRDDGLLRRGLSNYWGYNTIGFFAPHNGYSSTGQLGEQAHAVKLMRRTLHEAGIFVQAEVGIRHLYVTGVQTCALPIPTTPPRCSCTR